MVDILLFKGKSSLHTKYGTVSQMLLKLKDIFSCLDIFLKIHFFVKITKRILLNESY